MSTPYWFGVRSLSYEFQLEYIGDFARGKNQETDLLDIFYQETEVSRNCSIVGTGHTEESRTRELSGINSLSTMSPRLRNPRKLGVSVASWLKVDGLSLECMAAK